MLTVSILSLVGSLNVIFVFRAEVHQQVKMNPPIDGVDRFSGGIVAR